MNLVRAAMLMVVSVLVAATLAVVPPAVVQPAQAADSCGRGWHKQSNGVLAGSRTTRQHGRKATARLDGWVRFCTRNRGAKPDQKNQRVLISVPGSVVSRGDFRGRHGRICVTQKIVVHAKRVITGQTLTLSGVSPGFGVALGSTQSSTTRTRCAGPNARRIAIRPGVFRATAPNGVCTLWALGWAAACYAGPKIHRVEVFTTARMNYRRNRSAQQVNATQHEVDYS